ncbi:hypothetical protein GcM1_239013 [Golovinomyces cichoracearum]|uniref:Uncharacterized protein n=1 Tax=Golovinomyces cichoracearum TaxID=62708 RepID=A0A420IIM1_9PEZI|nr:hypothetical protein GcM1_239013 [Golovinomyces cichoracearum]
MDVEDLLNEDEDHQFEPRASNEYGTQAIRRTAVSGDSSEKPSGSVSTRRGREKQTKGRHLNEINGRERLRPIDYKDMLAQIRVTISILDLMQISTDAAKAFRHYSTRRNHKKGTKVSLIEGVASNLLTNSSHNTEPRGIQQHERPFRLLDATTICTKLRKNMIIDKRAAQANQGSDINLISDLLAGTVSLVIREIPGIRGFMMQTADGNLTTLLIFAIFKFSVAGI